MILSSIGHSKWKYFISLFVCVVIFTSAISFLLAKDVVADTINIKLNINRYKQTTGYTCGSASSMMILLAAGKKATLASNNISTDLDFHVKYSSRGKGKGIYLHEIVNGLNAYLGSGSYKQSNNIKNVDTLVSIVKDSLSKGCPVIASVWWDLIKGSSKGHYVVISGLCYKKDLPYFVIKDPISSTTDNLERSASDFYNCMPYPNNSNGGHILIYGTKKLGVEMETTTSYTAVTPSYISGAEYAVYSQNEYEYYTNSSGPGNLKSDGCCLFSFIHAIEWASRQSYKSNIINDLVNLSWPYLYPNGGNPISKYANYAKNLGLQIYAEKGSDYSGNKKGQAIRDLLNQGYVIVTYDMITHITAVVDYVICDSNGAVICDDGEVIPSGGSMYLKVIDSYPVASTRNPGRAYYNNVFTTSSGKLIPRDNFTDKDNSGCVYYVKYKEDKQLYIQRAIKGSWSGHKSTDGIRNYIEFSKKESYLVSRETYLYSKPIASSDYVTGSKLLKDYGFIAVGTCKDKDGNTWYVTNDSCFIRDDYVNKDEKRVLENLIEATHVGYVDAIVKQIKYDKVWLMDKPYSENTARLIPVSKNEQLRMKRVVKNSYGNYWVQFDNGYYLCANNVELVGYKVLPVSRTIEFTTLVHTRKIQ